MTYKVLLYILGLISFYSCSGTRPSITALCEIDEKGDCILKWELFPERDNVSIEIYASDNDSVFPSTPIVTTLANNYITVINKGDSLGYKYFRLKVDNVTSGVISNRFYNMDSVQNFRDMGGYRTVDGRQVRWGKLFRSGDFSRLTKQDKLTLDGLKLKTIIDFRPMSIANRRPDRLVVDNYYYLPVTERSYDKISDRIINGQFYRGDAVIYTQDLYKDIVENYSYIYADFFNKLCNEKNYPVAFHCFLGKDQTGIAAYFLLRALNVSSEIAEDDYRYSNIGIKKAKLINDVDELSESGQEALTMITRTDPTFLRYAISCIRSKYGSIDEYMTNELGLTPIKREKLQSLLLY